MKNIFSFNRVSQGTRMYATFNGKQRFYGKDDNYYLSYDMRIYTPSVTVVNAYSWAVIDMYGETLSSGYCSGTTEVDTSAPRARSIIISGLASQIATAMVLDAPKSETGDNPPYIPYDGGITPTPVHTDEISQAVAVNFVYNDESNTYSVTQFQPSIDSYDKMAKSFVLYICNADHIQPHSHISIFGNEFLIRHSNGEEVEHLIEAVPDMLPVLLDKESLTAKMLYSFNATIQTGLGLEDIFLDLGDRPFDPSDDVVITGVGVSTVDNDVTLTAQGNNLSNLSMFTWKIMCDSDTIEKVTYGPVITLVGSDKDKYNNSTSVSVLLRVGNYDSEEYTLK